MLFHFQVGNLLDVSYFSLTSYASKIRYFHFYLFEHSCLHRWLKRCVWWCYEQRRIARYSRGWGPFHQWGSYSPNAQEKIILTGSVARLTSANSQMPMSGPAYMDASVATPKLTANQHTMNGGDHLRVVERPDVHIIFPFWCSSDYSLSHVIQHVNYTQLPNFDNQEH